jgi:hypothetical protein
MKYDTKKTHSRTDTDYLVALSSTLDGGEGQVHDMTALTLDKESLRPLGTKFNWLQSLYELCGRRKGRRGGGELGI